MSYSKLLLHDILDKKISYIKETNAFNYPHIITKKLNNINDNSMLWLNLYTFKIKRKDNSNITNSITISFFFEDFNKKIKYVQLACKNIGITMPEDFFTEEIYKNLIKIKDKKTNKILNYLLFLNKQIEIYNKKMIIEEDFNVC